MPSKPAWSRQPMRRSAASKRAASARRTGRKGSRPAWSRRRFIRPERGPPGGPKLSCASLYRIIATRVIATLASYCNPRFAEATRTTWPEDSSRHHLSIASDRDVILQRRQACAFGAAGDRRNRRALGKNDNAGETIERDPAIRRGAGAGWPANTGQVRGAVSRRRPPPRHWRQAARTPRRALAFSCRIERIDPPVRVEARCCGPRRYARRLPRSSPFMIVRRPCDRPALSWPRAALSPVAA